MRLGILKHGHRPLQKLQLRLIQAISGAVPGPIRLMSYRRHFVGKKMSEAFQRAMRGPSDWSVGERELFSAFVSRLNQCAY